MWATLDQVSYRIQYGTSSKAGSDATGIPVLRMGNIQDGDLDLSNLEYLSAQDVDVQKTLLEHGDLLFNRTNSAELVGECAVFKGAPSRACFASYLIRVSFEGFLPEFACAYINSEHGRRWSRPVKYPCSQSSLLWDFEDLRSSGLWRPWRPSASNRVELEQDLTHYRYHCNVPRLPTLT